MASTTRSRVKAPGPSKESRWAASAPPEPMRSGTATDSPCAARPSRSANAAASAEGRSSGGEGRKAPATSHRTRAPCEGRASMGPSARRRGGAEADQELGLPPQLGHLVGQRTRGGIGAGGGGGARGGGGGRGDRPHLGE